MPDIDPRPINVDLYEAFTPEKLELIQGYLIDGPDYRDERIDLLMLLLVNEGLAEAVRLAPEDSWREALNRVYGGDS